MTWWVIMAIGIATYGLRASFLVVLGGRPMPRIEHYLRFVPVAVLPSIAVSAVLNHAGGGLDYASQPLSSAP